MTSMPKRYVRSSMPVLIYCGNNRPTSGLVRDGASWEEFNDQTITSYLEEGSDMLITSIKEFADIQTPYDSLRAKELRFMLEALIEVKEVFMNEQIPALGRE